MQVQMPHNTEAASALILTPDEVRRLMEDDAPETIIGMTEKIAGAYSHNELAPADAQAAEQIFRLLLRATELRVRVALAQQVKDSGTIPRDIVMTLAQDVAEVALPVLQYSEVLTDDDLLELVNNTEEVSRYLAVSRREFVSDAVSDTLLDKGDDEVAAALVQNEGAHISEEGFDKIIERHPTNDTLMRAMVERPRLPMAAAEKLITVVSSSLADTLKKKYQLPTEHIQQEADKAREGETLALVRASHSQDEVDKLVNQLYAFGRLTPSIILSALCQGNFAFFETSLAKLSNIKVQNARTLISDRGELGFRALYNKSGLSDAMFPAVKMLLKVVRELDVEGEKSGGKRFANRVVEKLLHYAESTSIDNLSYIIALVRRNAQ